MNLLDFHISSVHAQAITLRRKFLLYYIIIYTYIRDKYVPIPIKSFVMTSTTAAVTLFFGFFAGFACFCFLRLELADITYATVRHHRDFSYVEVDKYLGYEKFGVEFVEPVTPLDRKDEKRSTSTSESKYILRGSMGTKGIRVVREDGEPKDADRGSMEPKIIEAVRADGEICHKDEY
jgi:hypothetical protein